METKRTSADNDALLDLKTTDRLLKAMLVMARTVNHVLETRVIDESEYPLSKSKVRILRLLAQRGGQNSTQLANYLGVSKPAVSELVESLVSSDLVVREPSGRDRRAFQLKLTPLGRQVFRKNQARQRHMIRNATRAYPAQVDPWIELLSRMTQALAQADRTFEQFCFQCGAHQDKACILAGGEVVCPYLSHQERIHVNTARRTAGKNKPPAVSEA